jgi:hypothetical protein
MPPDKVEQCHVQIIICGGSVRILDIVIGRQAVR